MKNQEIDTLIDLIEQAVEDLRGYQEEIRELEGQRLKTMLNKVPSQAAARKHLIRDLEKKLAEIETDIHIAFKDIQRYVNHGDNLFNDETTGPE